MASNQTENYGLNQWVRSDKVVMEDFNADNAKLDAALAAKAEQSALTSLQYTVSRKGNCQIVMGSYFGNGKYGSGNPNSLSFSKVPELLVIGGPLLAIMLKSTGNGYVLQQGTSVSVTTSWGATSVSWYCTFPSDTANYQMNASGRWYSYIAFLEV